MCSVHAKIGWPSSKDPSDVQVQQHSRLETLTKGLDGNKCLTAGVKDKTQALTSLPGKFYFANLFLGVAPCFTAHRRDEVAK